MTRVRCDDSCMSCGDLCVRCDASCVRCDDLSFYYDWWLYEPGKCLGRFTNDNKTTPYCIKLNPDPDKQHLFIVGCADKKIYTVSQWVHIVPP